MCIADIYLDVTVASLLKQWKQLESGLELSAEAFLTLSKCFKGNTKQWLKADKTAQRTRSWKPEAMDIYDTSKGTGMGYIFLQLELHLWKY